MTDSRQRVITALRGGLHLLYSFTIAVAIWSIFEGFSRPMSENPSVLISAAATVLVTSAFGGWLAIKVGGQWGLIVRVISLALTIAALSFVVGVWAM
jgi:hypothetical protein